MDALTQHGVGNLPTVPDLRDPDRFGDLLQLCARGDTGLPGNDGSDPAEVRSETVGATPDPLSVHRESLVGLIDLISCSWTESQMWLICPVSDSYVSG